MEALRFSLMVLLVVFGAYAEYSADEYLRISKLRVTGAKPVQGVFEICSDNVVPRQVDLTTCLDPLMMRGGDREECEG
jgi:hypothetical protein